MFTRPKSGLDSEAMNAALAGYALAWAEVVARPDAYDVQAARDLLARRIIEAALDNGERDPEKLKTYALAGLAMRQPA